MPPRIAFDQPRLAHGRLTVTGQSPRLPDHTFVMRNVAFEQDGVCVHGATDNGPKGWSTVLDAPTFAADQTTNAVGTETYFVTLEEVPLFLTFTWSEVFATI